MWQKRNVIFGSALLALWMAIGVLPLAVGFEPMQGSSGKKMNEQTNDPFLHQRRQMVERQLAARDIRDKKVLEAMAKVPRHEFVPPQNRDESYVDGPLPIGLGQTISQPYIVALMTQLARVDSTSIVLEIGTGSGYQAAVLAEIVAHVYTIEIVDPLCHRADSALDRLGYKNITVECGDGYRGWPEHAPFDAVLVTAAPDHIPQPLIDQLKVNGRLIIPIGDRSQELLELVKTDSGVVTRSSIPVRFVPMTGEAEK
jgi:protein-L-isoaspartate(D-aspartate) O-methyltransferase